MRRSPRLKVLRLTEPRSQEVFLQRADFAQRVGVIEDQQVLGNLGVVGKVDFRQARDEFVEHRRAEARSREGETDRVDVVAPWHAAQQGGFHRRRAAAHERIIDHVAGLRLEVLERDRGASGGGFRIFRLQQRHGMAEMFFRRVAQLHGHRPARLDRRQVTSRAAQLGAHHPGGIVDFLGPRAEAQAKER